MNSEEQEQGRRDAFPKKRVLRQPRNLTPQQAAEERELLLGELDKAFETLEEQTATASGDSGREASDENQDAQEEKTGEI